MALSKPATQTALAPKQVKKIPYTGTSPVTAFSKPAAQTAPAPKQVKKKPHRGAQIALPRRKWIDLP